MTGDLDILYSVDSENIPRLLAAFQGLTAIYRDPAGRRIAPDEDKLSRYRFNLRRTDLGPLDALQMIGSGMTYADLISRAEILLSETDS